MSLSAAIAKAGFLGAVLLLAQLLVGTDVSVAVALSAAIVFGIATFLYSGMVSAFGLIAFALIFRFVFVAIVIKVLFLREPVDKGLQEPLTTSAVTAIGFLGILLSGILIKATRIDRSLFGTTITAFQYLILTFVLLTVGFGSWLLVRSQADENTFGGIWGIARALSAYGELAVVTSLLYAWSKGTKRYLTHPLAMLSVAASVGVGILSTGKQAIIEPLFFFIMMAFVRYGVFYFRAWIVGILAVLAFGGLIYPYSQYIRYQGGRDANLQYAISQIIDVSWRMMTDSGFRDTVRNVTVEQESSNEEVSPYLGPEYRWAARFAMIGEADRLIAATERSQIYTGWSTIAAGFDYLTPHFLNPDKRESATGNDLGYLSGELNDDDFTTQISYGFFANLFNAFGYAGVLIGTVFLLVPLFVWFKLFWKNLDYPSFWMLIVVFSCHHLIVEGAIAHVMSFYRLPFYISFVWLVTLSMSKLLASKNRHSEIIIYPR